MSKLNEARAIIDYAQEDDAKQMRDAFYSALQDKILAHIESHKQEVARSLVSQEEVQHEEEAEEDDETHEEITDELDEEVEELDEAKRVRKLSPNFADKEKEAKAVAMLMGKMKKSGGSSTETGVTTHAGKSYGGAAQAPDEDEDDTVASSPVVVPKATSSDKAQDILAQIRARQKKA
mgnify:CR=1 FL=1